MILYHPMPKPANLKAIEKYKDRKVNVKSIYGWLHVVDNKNIWDKNGSQLMTFKDALKRTKNYKESHKIEYHFISDLGNEKPTIKDFEPENIYDVADGLIKFDNEVEARRQRRKVDNGDK